MAPVHTIKLDIVLHCLFECSLHLVVGLFVFEYSKDIVLCKPEMFNAFAQMSSAGSGDSG